MSIDAIKQELANLDENRRKEIIAFLISMNDRDDPEYQASLTRKLDDKDPSRWVSLEELERRFLEKEDDRAR